LCFASAAGPEQAPEAARRKVGRVSGLQFFMMPGVAAGPKTP
jgi:hypothetical protein